MEFTQEQLEKAAESGSAKVADAFSKLSRSRVSVSVSRADAVPLQESLKRLNTPKEHSIVVYAQLLEGVPGASILVLSRENALVLVDLLNQQQPGTTGVLKDIDRSAIKETLNILSNSYMNAISESTNMSIGLGVPGMISPTRFEEILEDLIEKDAGQDDVAILFNTTLTITEHEVQADFSLLFNERLATLIKKGE